MPRPNRDPMKTNMNEVMPLLQKEYSPLRNVDPSSVVPHNDWVLFKAHTTERVGALYIPDKFKELMTVFEAITVGANVDHVKPGDVCAVVGGLVYLPEIDPTYGLAPSGNIVGVIRGLDIREELRRIAEPPSSIILPQGVVVP